jgi:hypothetical protein
MADRPEPEIRLAEELAHLPEGAANAFARLHARHTYRAPLAGASLTTSIFPASTCSSRRAGLLLLAGNGMFSLHGTDTIDLNARACLETLESHPDFEATPNPTFVIVGSHYVTANASDGRPVVVSTDAEVSAIENGGEYIVRTANSTFVPEQAIRVKVRGYNLDGTFAPFGGRHHWMCVLQLGQKVFLSG